MQRETLAIHAGYRPDSAHTIGVPIYQSAAYEFDSAAHAASLFDLEQPGWRYSRINNPTTDVLDKRMAALEGGVGALCVASGQAAVDIAISNIARPGDNIVSVPQLYGTTHTLFAYKMTRDMGISVRFAASDRAEDIAQMIDERTRAVYCESVGNPAGNVCDIQALAEVAHQNGVPLIVDNTVATPMLLRPFEFGADIVVHSMTKFLSGHGNVLGGVIVDSGNFPWEAYPQRYPMFSQPDPSYHGLVYSERFKNRAYIERCRSYGVRLGGAVIAAHTSYMILLGIETLALRIERHVANARLVAEFLQDHPLVEWVNYAGFESSPYYALTRKMLGGRACALLTFGVAGGYHAGVRFYDALELVKRCVNLGDVRSLACHPASTTHRQMPPEYQAKAGVTPEAIRLSVGLEHITDITADLSQALEKSVG